MAQRHIYILDTCVLLHDPKSLFKFQNNDVYLPLAVIDDLDDQKARKEAVAASAREVFRQLKPLNLDQIGDEGIPLNKEGGKLFIYNHDKQSETPNITRMNSDNALIVCCLVLQAKFPDQKVTIVTKDTGLRVRAAAYGCLTENYRSDLIEDGIYSGVRYITTTLIPAEAKVEVQSINKKLKAKLENLNPNEFVIFQTPKKAEEIVTSKVYHHFDGFLYEVAATTDTFMGIKPKNIEQECAMQLLIDQRIHMVCLSGKAGSGKTILALAAAMDQINAGVFNKIIVIKPIVPVGGKDIGALPGDKFEKLAPWLGPISDNFAQLCGNFGFHGADTFEAAVKDGLIEVEAMAYIQGRSIPKTVILVDEAQNLTPREARNIVERCGEGSKIILLGDVSQIENNYLDKESCGLAHAMNGTKAHDICGCVTLKSVTRSPLAAIASEIFSSPEAQGR